MIKNIDDDFNFDKWSTLASKDPEAFEEYRERVISEFINELPEEKQQRMKGLQWKVDSVRNLSKTPMAACIEISKMMWESVKGENGLLEAINELQVACQFNDDYVPFDKPVDDAAILSFPAKDLATKPQASSTQDLL